MTVNNIEVPNDEYLRELKQGLSARAVLKAELADFKSSCPSSYIFACEGTSDTIIYSHWIAKLQPDLDYEPFICRNKNQLLQLFDSMQRDLNGLRENVYFFIDRDFDELKGRNANSSVFMTETYSIENYLVCKEILDDLLKIEFRCHGNKEVRKRIIALFESVYEEFLDRTKEINFRIYLARKIGIRQIEDLPKRLSDLADVQLDSVKVGQGQPSILVQLEREPSDAEKEEHKSDFEKLDRQSRYRGKFAILFFNKWLSLVLTDRNSANSSFFNGLPQEGFAGKAPSFDVLASKSQPPEAFRIFLQKLTEVQETKVALA